MRKDATVLLHSLILEKKKEKTLLCITTLNSAWSLHSLSSLSPMCAIIVEVHHLGFWDIHLTLANVSHVATWSW